MANKITTPNFNRNIVSNGLVEQEFRAWIINITDRALILGSGSPEGVIIANIGTEYADLNGSTGSIKYIKLKDNIGGDKSKGWVLE